MYKNKQLQYWSRAFIGVVTPHFHVTLNMALNGRESQCTFLENAIKNLTGY